MKNKSTNKELSSGAVKSLESAKYHFLTANRENVLALNELLEFIKQTIEGHDDSPAVSSLSSLLTLMQMMLNVIINKLIEPLRAGEAPADAGEILFLINSMIDEELSKLDKSDPSDPRLQILWAIKEIASGKRKQRANKRIKRITIE
ncbi:MAG: hypothetical protein M1491_05330 [Deltaproteobacteria bacterium]|nr:hypothetical protein [Deltaproteobacteria bacterium]MCL5278082.1 hypothetical protein [Deltaproteobacteria bacterium]